jgi:PAS domain S-box-containing protein
MDISSTNSPAQGQSTLGAEPAKSGIEIPGSAQASNALHESEALFRAIWEASADAMALSDEQGTVLDVNMAYIELYGYTYEEVVGQNFAVIFPEDFRSLANQEYQEAFHIREVPPAFERVIQRKDGTRRVVDARIDFIEEAGTRVAMLSSIRDITERIQNEEALRESEERFRQTFDNAPIGMALMGMDFKPFKVNQALCSFFGYSEAELTNLTVADLTHPDDLAADLELAEHLLKGEIPSYTIEKRYITKSGDIVWAQLSVAVMRDKAGNIIYALAMLEDITQRRGAEEERLHMLGREKAARALAERAVQAQEELISLVSHDLNNPLAVVKGATQLLQRGIDKGQPPEPAQLASFTAQIRMAVERMESFIRDLSMPQRVQPGQLLSITPKLMDLVALAQRVASSHQQRTERHQLLAETTCSELMGYWDAARLEQVLDNLISNAVKYSPEGGTINIVVGYEETPAVGPTSEAPGALPHTPRALMAVRDEGMGIPADDLPYVFEWYRRAANVRDIITGTGIGLAGARQIIEQHGGSISVESTEGVGSTFTVLLPLNYASVPVSTPAPSDSDQQQA